MIYSSGKIQTPNRKQDNNKLDSVCPSSIYGFWYLKYFLKRINFHK
jgi:hypothetical protein